MTVRAPDGGRNSLIFTMRGSLGWLTFGAAWDTSAVMNRAETCELANRLTGSFEVAE